MTDKALSILIHGHSKVGKSTLAVTAPAPRLYLDVEAASRFLPIKRKVWNPYTEPIPEYDGSWDTVVVYTRDFDTMKRVYKRINEEPHPFKSFIIDSVSELQVRLREKLVGSGQMQLQQWNELLNVMAKTMRDIRDLTMHETYPLEAVVLTAMTKEFDGIYKPYLQGSIAAQMPYWFDVVGYYFVDQIPNENPEIAATTERILLTRKHEKYEAGERVQGRIDEWIFSPNIEDMINQIFSN